MTLFTRLSQLILRQGDRLHFELIGSEEAQIKVLITPDLGPTPTNASDEELNLRTLLATPITITGKPEEVDSLLNEHLAKRAAIQRNGVDALNALSAKMAEAAKQASNAKPAKSEKPGKSAKAAAAEAPPSPKEEVKPTPVKAPSLTDSF